jgi:hypothetical protein
MEGKTKGEIRVHQVLLLADELMKLMRYLDKFPIKRWNMLHPSPSLHNDFCLVLST